METGKLGPYSNDFSYLTLGLNKPIMLLFQVQHDLCIVVANIGTMQGVDSVDQSDQLPVNPFEIAAPIKHIFDGKNMPKVKEYHPETRENSQCGPSHHCCIVQTRDFGNFSLSLYRGRHIEDLAVATNAVKSKYFTPDIVSASGGPAARAVLVSPNMQRAA